MAVETLNLIYTKNQKFFAGITKIKDTITIYTNQPSEAKFNQFHEAEIGRGKSYAVFDELEEDVEKHRKVTIASFRQSLIRRGVTEVDFQNKILCLMLQNELGLHFPLGKLIDELFLAKNHLFVMGSTYQLALEVNKAKKVTLIFKGIWQEVTADNERIPAISAELRVSITPHRVSISDLHLVKLSDTPASNETFKFLQANQKGILEKILIFFQQLFGCNEDMRLESNDDVIWRPKP